MALTAKSPPAATGGTPNALSCRLAEGSSEHKPKANLPQGLPNRAVSPDLEKETAARGGITGGGNREIEKASNLQGGDYAAFLRSAITLPQVRAALERDRMARERLGLIRWEAGR